MASMRALPTYAPAYTSLGLCYSSATPPDEERALKCFQKAFELDATETEAARRLASGYADQDEWSLVRQVATRVMEGEGGLDGVAGGDTMNLKGRFAPKNGWAWKALGSTEVVSCGVVSLLTISTTKTTPKRHRHTKSPYELSLMMSPPG